LTSPWKFLQRTRASDEAIENAVLRLEVTSGQEVVQATEIRLGRA
jgi:hypothetical protein